MGLANCCLYFMGGTLPPILRVPLTVSHFQLLEQALPVVVTLPIRWL